MSIHETAKDSDGRTIITDINLSEINISTDCTQAAKDLFPVGSFWKDYSALKNAVEKYSPLAGFECKSTSYRMECSRAGKPRCRSKNGLPRSQISLQLGCTFCIKTTSTRKGKPSTGQQKTSETPCATIPNKKERNRPLYYDGVTIQISNKTCYHHSNGCKPSPPQLIYHRCASGKYVLHISATATSI